MQVSKQNFKSLKSVLQQWEQVSPRVKGKQDEAGAGPSSSS